MQAETVIVIVIIVGTIVLVSQSKIKWIKAIAVTLSILVILSYWFISTIGIIKGYPIANSEGEIIAMMAPVHSRVQSSRNNWIKSYRLQNNLNEEYVLYRTWKKNYFRLGMWGRYVSDKEYWILEYIEVNNN